MGAVTCTILFCCVNKIVTCQNRDPVILGIQKLIQNLVEKMKKMNFKIYGKKVGQTRDNKSGSCDN